MAEINRQSCSICGDDLNDEHQRSSEDASVLQRALISYKKMLEIEEYAKIIPGKIRYYKLLNKMKIKKLKGLSENNNWPNSSILNWLYKVYFQINDPLDPLIPMRYSSVPFRLLFDQQHVKQIEIAESEELDVKACNQCAKILQTYSKHEKRCQFISMKLLKLLVKPLTNITKLKTNLCESKEDVGFPTPLSDMDATKTSVLDYKKDLVYPDAVPTREPTSKIITEPTTQIVKNDINQSTPLKRKRGRPKKNIAEKSKIKIKKESTMDSTKSICPFCSKIYSIQHSFVHNCLTYRNSLYCPKCNVFSATYVRFEKHLENYHSHKEVFHCQVPNCNQKCISKPAFVWHNHFHTLEDRLPQIPTVIQDNSGTSISSITVSKNDISVDCKSIKTLPKSEICVVPSPSAVPVNYNEICHETFRTSPPILVVTNQQSENVLEGTKKLKTAVLGNENYTTTKECQTKTKAKTVSSTSHYTTNANTIDPACNQDSFLIEGTKSVLCSSKHEQLHVYEKSYIFFCDLCEKHFSNKTDLEEHLISHSVGQNISCNDCKKKFDNQIKLEQHLSNCHSVSVDHKQKNINGFFSKSTAKYTGQNIPLYRCSACYMLFSSKEDILSHINKHKVKNSSKCTSYLCLWCNEQFNSELDLSEHCLSYCAAAKTKNYQGNGTKNFSDTWNTDMAQHISEEHSVGQHEYRCPVCDLSFIEVKSLTSHLNSHDSREMCKCKICFNALRRQNVAGNNRNKERGIVNNVTQKLNNDLICSYCNLLFSSAADLSSHNLVQHSSSGLTERSDRSIDKKQSGHLNSNRNEDFRFETVGNPVLRYDGVVSAPLKVVNSADPTNLGTLQTYHTLLTDHTQSEHMLNLPSNHTLHELKSKTPYTDASGPSNSCLTCGIVFHNHVMLLAHMQSIHHMINKVEVPFTDASDDRFMTKTENLSVVKALEGSGENSLTPIEHLIGSVDDYLI